MYFTPLLQSQGSNILMFGTIGLVFLIFYIFIIRPQKKEQQKTQAMINALKKGDKVVTIGGIHGVVTSTKEKTVVLRVDDNCKIEMNRGAIASVAVDEKKAKAAQIEAGKQEEQKKIGFFNRKKNTDDQKEAQSSDEKKGPQFR